MQIHLEQLARFGLSRKIGNLSLKSETVHMRPVNRDAAHICRLYRCPEKIYRQRRRQREEGKGQGAAAEAAAAPVPVSVPDAGGDKRCRRLTFCHPNLPQSLPLPLPSTRGSREKGGGEGGGFGKLVLRAVAFKVNALSQNRSTEPEIWR